MRRSSLIPARRVYITNYNRAANVLWINSLSHKMCRAPTPPLCAFSPNNCTRVGKDLFVAQVLSRAAEASWTVMRKGGVEFWPNEPAKRARSHLMKPIYFKTFLSCIIMVCVPAAMVRDECLITISPAHMFICVRTQPKLKARKKLAESCVCFEI